MKPLSTRPLSIPSGDAAHRPGATQSPWRLWPVWAEPGVQPEFPSQVHNGFYRNDNNRNKRIKSGSGGYFNSKLQGLDL